MPSNNLSNSLSSHEPFSKLDRWSLSLDGSDERMDAGDITIVDGLSDMSISAWVKPNASATGSNPIITKGSYNSDGASFYLGYAPESDEGDGRLNFSVEKRSDVEGGEGMYAYCNGVGSTFNGNWTHVVVSYSNTSDAVVFYLNNSVETIDSTNGSFIDIPSNSLDMRVCQGFHGHVSDLALYSSALSASDVSKIYDGGDSYRHDTGVASANLIAWWRMGDGAENGTGTTIYDESSNSNNLTIQNTDGDEFEEDSP